VLTGITYLLADRLSKSNLMASYTGEVLIRVEPVDSNAAFSMKLVQEVIGNRMKAAFIQYSIERTGDDRLRLTFRQLFDTSKIYQYVTARGEVGFWEMYSILDLSEWVKAIREKLNQEGSTALLDHRVDFMNSYKDYVGELEVYPAEILSIRKEDTSWFRTLILDPDISQAFPKDGRLVFAANEYSNGRLYAFVIRTRSWTTAILNNEDIRTAEIDYDLTGYNSITVTFHRSGVQKWQALTEKNVNKPIAILVDDLVLSTPRVEAPIRDGTAKISGFFTTDESLVLSNVLSGDALPVQLHILSRKYELALTKAKKTRVLIWTGAFIFFSILAFIIFKLLKPSNRPS
jgi:hypothetical protein